MEPQRKKEFLLNAAYYGTLLAGAYLFCTYLLPVLFPFLLGFFIAWMLRRPADFLSRKLHIPRKLGRAVLTALFYLLLLALFLLAGSKVVNLAVEGLPKLPDLVTGQILPTIEAWSDALEQWLGNFDPDLSSGVEKVYQQFSASMGTWASSFVSTALQAVSKAAVRVPGWILRTVLAVISTFFIAVDLERITGFLKRHCPEQVLRLLQVFRQQGTRSIKVYLRSYGLILCMTFWELTVGLFLLRVPHAIPLALVVALMDILPVLGTGLVLIPWGICALLMGQYGMGIGVLVLYVVITVVRNIVEPRLVGKQIGLHPLVTLIGMFIGAQFFGILGLFGLPILLSVLTKLDWTQFKGSLRQRTEREQEG